MQVRPQFAEAQKPVHGPAISDDVKIRDTEVDDPHAGGVLDIRVANIPFLRNTPVVRRRSGRHLLHCQWNLLGQHRQRLTNTVTANAAADWIQTTDAIVQLGTSSVGSEHFPRGRNRTHFSDAVQGATHGRVTFTTTADCVWY